MTRQMTLMRESRCQSYLRNGEFILHQQILRAFNPALNNVLVQRNAGGLAEQRFEVRRTDTADRSDVGQREIFGEMVFDVGQSLLEPATAEAAALCDRMLRYGAVSGD